MVHGFNRLHRLLETVDRDDSRNTLNSAPTLVSSMGVAARVVFEAKNWVWSVYRFEQTLQTTVGKQSLNLPLATFVGLKQSSA